jgi:hypothetical protein
VATVRLLIDRVVALAEARKRKAVSLGSRGQRQCVEVLAPGRRGRELLDDEVAIMSALRNIDAGVPLKTAIGRVAVMLVPERSAPGFCNW